MPKSIYSVAVNEILAAEMRSQPRMIFFQTQPNSELDSLLDSVGKERVRKSISNTSPSASALLGAAAGAARMGHPVMIAGSTALLDGLTPDFFRAVEGATAPVVIRILCEDYEDSNRRLDLPPEWTFAAPSTPADAAGLLRYAIRNPQPSLLIESRALQETRGEIPVRALLKPGRAFVRRKGADLTLITLGPLTGEILGSLEITSCISPSQEGNRSPDFHDFEVIDLRTLQPLDVELSIQSLRKTGRVILCPQSLVLSGFVAPMMNAIHAHAFDELDAPIRVFDGLTLRKTNWQEELKRRTTMTNY